MIHYRAIGYIQHGNYETLLLSCWEQGTVQGGRGLGGGVVGVWVGVRVCVCQGVCDTEGEDKSDETNLLSWRPCCLHKSATGESLTEVDTHTVPVSSSRF